MISERAKWIEIWLDNAGERAYQAAFVSALASAKYTILHNTRHSSLELGKDVIARSPDGDLIAFQLKGNPGGRLTMAQWHDIYTQVVQLVGSPVPKAIGNRSAEPHRPILVTNGEVDEDVTAAISLFNDQVVPTLPAAMPLECWTRGRVLALISAESEAAWPGDIASQILVAKIVASDGLDRVDADDFQHLTTAILKWGDKISRTSAVERAHAASTLIAICRTPFEASGNAFESIRLATIWYSTLSGYIDNCGIASMRRSKLLLAALREDVVSLLRIYVDAISASFKKRPLSNDNVLAEFAIYHPRKMLVTALVSVAILDRVLGGSSAYERQDWVEFLERSSLYPFLLYEGMIPPFLATFWAKDNVFATTRCDYELAGVLSVVCREQLNESRIGLPQPFYELDEIVLWKNMVFLGERWNKIERDRTFGRSWFAYPLLLMLVRRNFKQTVRLIWPDVTRLRLIESALKQPSEFGFYRSESAVEVDQVIAVPRRWQDLVDEVRIAGEPLMPSALASDPIMVLLSCIFLPHRMSGRTVAWLDRKLARTWY